MADDRNDRASREAGSAVAILEQAWLFWLVVGLCLAPIWWIHFLPTQDGPAHLANAVILKDYDSPGARYRNFFEVRWEPLPNWTVHLLLAGLLHVVPPLSAEKIVVSLYALGFAWAFRYLQTAFGRPGGPVSLGALLLVYPRCFWMGFYNYCLSLVLFLALVGFCVRRSQWTSRDAAIVCLLLLATWFTHLLGFLLAAAAALWLGASPTGPRLSRLGWIIIAALPASMLTASYVQRTGFFREGVLGDLIPSFEVREIGARVARELDGFGTQLFAPYGRPPELLVYVMIALFGGALLWTIAAEVGRTMMGPPRWPVVLLACAIMAVYVLIPDHLPGTHGGHLKCRLAPLPFLLGLALTRPPTGLATWVLGGAALVGVAMNLTLIGMHVAVMQPDLREFTAAREQIGERQVLFVSRGDAGRLPVEHLEHAADHYCLESGNINLDNHAAATPYFPVRFRPSVNRARGHFPSYPNRADVDRVISWAMDVREETAPLRIIFRQHRLVVKTTR
jgi:hypothetical protein